MTPREFGARSLAERRRMTDHFLDFHKYREEAIEEAKREAENG